MARSLADTAAVQQWLDPVAEWLQPRLQGLLSDASVGNLLDGVWFGAPLHPALTDVPVGSWTAALVLDAVDVFAGDPRLGFAADAALAVGTAAAVPAAVTGLADFRWLPGEIRRVGLTHAGLNSISVALSVASLLARRRGRRARGRALSLAAYTISSSSAHLGGTMSFGLGERVNHEIETGAPDGFTAVLDDAELSAGQLVRVDVEGTPVLLTRASDGAVCAISNTCSHAGGPLNEGAREGDVVTCPWHGSRFDVCTGKVRQGPAVYPQRRFGTRVRDGRIEVGPPDQA
ncbi:MAG TPA: Rieske (2Fe-2S) protein [Solirubrobacteraceae bacterium]|jgi:nitrite reductase/ring-hydroxylating ferredoxin subunit/uncharacterized membrane protein